ncbi:unnamed protein product [Prorocentrum cordatum]|uniref:Uncharacterized protein n=1 Tax=Prorocentrum cordatum TaxID=2364126 RepID=A0ABN9PDI9_9DINO|nr:unnamed protein product [Polarella glacialis]
MAPRLCCEVTPMLNTSCASSTTNSMTRQQHACKERKDVRIPCQRPVLAAHPNSILAGIARANSSADARACFTRWRSTGTWSEHIARAV